jgi:hypothetical protein
MSRAHYSTLLYSFLTLPIFHSINSITAITSSLLQQLIEMTNLKQNYEMRALDAAPSYGDTQPALSSSSSACSNIDTIVPSFICLPSHQILYNSHST